ncbi:MAG: transcriptional regulator [Pseudoalteromonas sp.]|nr:transcriptional regulator [Pseudoalteromonas sp.]|tara:strand:+ start:1858 stop:2478 length:621 start_codon:yes stop_codon:yes gene_type:complete
MPLYREGLYLLASFLYSKEVVNYFLKNMKFSFQIFQFDCEHKILTRHGKVIKLKDRAANMLKFFILNNDRILSKAELLETVWPDKTVSEQVVFQNISHLRAIFGNDAIKTFSKRGYQWQLELTEVTEQAEEVVAVPEPQAPASEESKTEIESSNNESSDKAQKNDAPTSESTPEQPVKDSKSTTWLGILGAAALVVATAIWMAVKS